MSTSTSTSTSKRKSTDLGGEGHRRSARISASQRAGPDATATATGRVARGSSTSSVTGSRRGSGSAATMPTITGPMTRPAGTAAGSATLSAAVSTGSARTKRITTNEMTSRRSGIRTEAADDRQRETGQETQSHLRDADRDDRDNDTTAESTQVSPARLEGFHMPELSPGSVFYQENFLTETEAKEWYHDLAALDTYHPTLHLYGRAIPQSRAIAAYAPRPMAMKYSGAQIDVHSPLPAALARMQARVEDALGVVFNHVLLNRYEDGGVYIGRHSDTQDQGVIVSISVGARRKFVMTPRLPLKSAGIVVSPAQKKVLDKRAPVKWVLGNGSMLVMQGQTQDFWKHEIPREPSVKERRISLTFRQLL